MAADRWNCKRTMIAMDAVRVLGAASIVVALALDDLTFAQIVIVAFIEGSAFVFFNIAEVRALRSVVPARQLPDAAAAQQARFASATLAGPPLGGVLFGLGRALPFLADALSYAFSIGSLLWMRTPFQETRERDTAPLRAQIREGIAWLWRQPYLRTSAQHGLSSGAIGALIAAFGTAGLLGSLVAPRAEKALSIRTIMLLNQWLNGLFVVFLFVQSPYVLVAGVLPVAFLSPWLNAVVIGYRTAVTPDHLVGRVSSVARNIALLAQPLGPLAAGLLLAAFSARVTVLVPAATCVALAVFSTLSPSIRDAPSLDELDTLSPA